MPPHLRIPRSINAHMRKKATRTHNTNTKPNRDCDINSIKKRYRKCDICTIKQPNRDCDTNSLQKTNRNCDLETPRKLNHDCDTGSITQRSTHCTLSNHTFQRSYTQHITDNFAKRQLSQKKQKNKQNKKQKNKQKHKTTWICCRTGRNLPTRNRAKSKQVKIAATYTFYDITKAHRFPLSTPCPKSLPNHHTATFVKTHHVQYPTAEHSY